ncbi:MAG: hypothetical protein IPO07_24725 [Haliscomenobacter sp.]|nr:hypothetical protein [Haliscomenobacter sp.]
MTTSVKVLNAVSRHFPPMAISETPDQYPTASTDQWPGSLGFGVFYLRSREARMEESKDSGGGDFYAKVYDADRPELFFKATAARTVGSGEVVLIRRDSKWNVPEPELTLF